MNWKEAFDKYGLPVIAGTLTIAASLASKKNNDKAMEKTIAEKVNEALANKLKES